MIATNDKCSYKSFVNEASLNERKIKICFIITIIQLCFSLILAYFLQNYEKTNFKLNYCNFSKCVNFEAEIKLQAVFFKVK